MKCLSIATLACFTFLSFAQAEEDPFGVGEEAQQEELKQDARLRQLLAQGEKACPELKVFIEAKVDDLRPKAIMMLGEIGGKEDLDLLHTLLKDPSNAAQVAALQSLAKIGDKSSEPFIREWIKDHGETAEASNALSLLSLSIENRRILAQLEEQTFCGTMSEEEVQKIERNRNHFKALGEKAYPAMRHALLDLDDLYSSSFIAEAIVEGKGEPEQKRALLREALVGLMSEHVPKLPPRRSPESRVEQRQCTRECLITALGKIGTNEDLPVLHTALPSGGYREQRACLDAIAFIRDKSSIEFLRTWQQKRKKLANAGEEQWLNEKVKEIIWLLDPHSEAGEVLALLPQGRYGEPLKDQEQKNLNRLIAMGPDTDPVFCRDLPYAKADRALWIIDVFVQSKGDKTYPLGYMREELNDFKRTDEERQRVNLGILKAYGAIGGKNELERIHEQLFGRDEEEQSACLDALAKMGDESSIAAIKRWQQHEKNVNREIPKRLEPKIAETIKSIEARIRK